MCRMASFVLTLIVSCCTFLQDLFWCRKMCEKPFRCEECRHRGCTPIKRRESEVQPFSFINCDFLQSDCATLDSSDFTWKTSERGWLHFTFPHSLRATEFCTRATDGGCKCNGTRRPLTWWQLQWSTQTLPVAPFALAGCDERRDPSLLESSSKDVEA